mmetsp:Transcript_26585/g.62176  ORF Transcript_26585/g.62176 Transcript_26585/m.62176 type:complete len:912 (+) Transcript_26585:145-2880(+)
MDSPGKSPWTRTIGGICLAGDDCDDDQYYDSTKLNASDENLNQSSLSSKVELKRDMKNKLKDRRSLMKKQASSRRRRRSSARFLRITPDDDDNDNGHYDGVSSTSLGEVYRNAIRMNAENRINAANSWNLNLIDHLDRFIAPELRSDSGGGSGGRQLHRMNGGSTNTIRSKMESTMDATLISGVNFTKASCTLDASVKIYSYRVDDVHLTSYKVLANLNRTDTNAASNDEKKNSDNVCEGNNNGARDNVSGESKTQSASSRRKTTVADTLEQNVANINIHKLDAAFDIDPLFHKMSKTFDEGGARGLLLANLGVGSAGCNIVFDSTLDTEDVGTEIEEDLEKLLPLKKTSVDVKSLVEKLGSELSDATGRSSSLQNMMLVPQLGSLRDQYTELRKRGFVEEAGKSSDRYASSFEEEIEADKSIHLEAIERSRASQGDLGRSIISRGSVVTYGSVGACDYDDGGFGYIGDEVDVFGDLQNGSHRFSSSSFEPTRGSFENSNENNCDESSPKKAPSEFSGPMHSQVSILLDAIASGDIATIQADNHYEYFSNQALKSLSSGNLWAGAEHWKKMPSGRRHKTKVGALNATSYSRGDVLKRDSKADSRMKKGVKGKTKSALYSDSDLLVSISNPIENLEAMVEKPSRRRGKNLVDPLQFSNTARVKYGRVNNLLPMDAGLAIKELVTLFLRPKANLVDMAKTNQDETDSMYVAKSTKAVGFGGVETWGVDDENSYGYDDDGLGFDSTDNEDRKPYAEDDNEFVIPDLVGVRKVDKIKIGYATVARKVDVKRLKRDLWTELEQTFEEKNQNAINVGKQIENDDSDDLSTASTVLDSTVAPPTSSDDDNGESINNRDERNDIAASLSFQDTVRDMQARQSQTDVTLPFYFICILHLCNEKGLSLESSGLEDFIIHNS